MRVGFLGRVAFTQTECDSQRTDIIIAMWLLQQLVLKKLVIDAAERSAVGKCSFPRSHRSRVTSQL